MAKSKMDYSDLLRRLCDFKIDDNNNDLSTLCSKIEASQKAWQDWSERHKQRQSVNGNLKVPPRLICNFLRRGNSHFFYLLIDNSFLQSL
jgi:uncharacterized protein YdiU (UPF0061 family)